MFDVVIKTKFNTIYISVEMMEDLVEVLSMPYVICFEKKETKKNNFKVLKKYNIIKKGDSNGR